MIQPAPQRYSKHPLARLESRWVKLGVYYGAATVLGVTGYIVVLVLRGHHQLRQQSKRHGLFKR
jgi:hypothetical protein